MAWEMVFKRVCTLDDIWAGEMDVFEVDGQDVLVIVAEGGEVRALQAICPHQNIPLAEGTLDGTTLTCRAHLWQFDVLAGRSINPEGCEIAKYPVNVENDVVYVDVEGIEPKHAPPGF